LRWESLFADLEAQLHEAESAELAAEIADRTRREVARLRVVDRLRGSVDHEITVHIRGGQPVCGRLKSVGPDWILLVDEATRDLLVPIPAVVGISGLTSWSSEPGSESVVDARLNLSHALRALARNRVVVQMTLVDGSTLAGTVDRVGADFVELAEHPLDEIRREAAVRRVRLVPTSVIGCLRG
jgi:hypothetical protein